MLDSCVVRDRGKLEILIFDGGSKDNTVDVVLNHKNKPDYFVSEPDDGQAAAINSGLSMAKGDWVAFQNSDDFYMPGALDVVCDSLEGINKEGYDIVVGGTLFVDSERKTLACHSQKPLLYLSFAARNYLHNQSLFVSREFLDKVGYLDSNLKFCLDYEWFLRIMKMNPKIKILKNIIGVQRFHEETKTSGMQNVHDFEFNEIRNIYFNRSEIILSKFVDPLYRIFRFSYSRINNLPCIGVGEYV